MMFFWQSTGLSEEEKLTTSGVPPVEVKINDELAKGYFLQYIFKPNFI